MLYIVSFVMIHAETKSLTCEV